MEQRYVPLTFTAGATSLTATAPANANIAPPGHLHAVPRRRQRRPVGGAHGQRQRQLAADRHAHTAGERRHLHRARHGEPRRERLRLRRHASPRSSSSTARRSSARTRPPPTLHLDRRHGRDLHRHRAGHRRPGLHHHQRAGHDHVKPRTRRRPRRSRRRPTARCSHGSRRSRSRPPRATPTAASPRSSSATARRCSARTRPPRTPTRGGTSHRQPRDDCRATDNAGAATTSSPAASPFGRSAERVPCSSLKDIRFGESGLVSAFRYDLAHGAWRSLVSALVWGTRGPEFESRRPDVEKSR